MHANTFTLMFLCVFLYVVGWTSSDKPQIEFSLAYSK